MFKLKQLNISTKVFNTIALSGVLTTMILAVGKDPAQAQFVQIRRSPYPVNPYPVNPYPGNLYIPGTVSPVSPIGPIGGWSQQPAVLPVAVPRPYPTYGNGTIVNSTLINPTVVNSTIVDSTLVNPTIVNSTVVGYPTVVNTLPGSAQVVSGLPSNVVSILQTNNLATGYRYYTQSNGSGNTLVVQVDSQPWLALSGPSKFQVLQGIGSIYAGQGFSFIIESRNQQTLGKYVCNGNSAAYCNPIVLY